MKKLFLALFVLFSLSLVGAQPDCSFNITNTMQLLLSMPLINSQISSCNVTLPEQLGILNNENVAITLTMNSEQSQSFYVSFVDDALSQINTGMPQDYSYEIILSESTLDNLLQSEDILSELLANYDSGEIIVNPNGVWSSVVWFFAKFFI